MKIRNSVALVTGGGNGIGRALCRALSNAGTAGVIVADRDEAAARAVAEEIGGLAVTVDVADEASVRELIEAALERYGRIDLVCSNAGILLEGGVETPDADWQRAWEVNFLSNIYLARAVLPGMLERGSGTFLVTASAAGLLNQPGCLAYAVTKHAAVAFAEWLAFTYAHRGLQVACLCPMGVKTAMLADNLETSPLARHLSRDALEPEAVAAVAIEGLKDGRFLILPHPQVGDFYRGKAADIERWLGGMGKLVRSLEQG
jgi:NAD(P)-dependent dehydrogenase (short-subunit alcohol dehydrogenase family)